MTSTTVKSEFDRIPPHDIGSEMCVLGSMMLAGDNHEIADQIRDTLRTESFYQADHGIIFDAICRLHSAHKPIDAVTVRAELDRAKLLDEVGGVPYLMQIIDAVPSSAHGAHYAEIVREKYVLREIIRSANKSIARAWSPSRIDCAADIAREFLNDLSAIAYCGTTEQIHKLSEALAQVVSEYDTKVKKRIPTGLREVDDITGGIPLGKFTLIGGRPRIGKSQLCKQIGLNAARAGIPVGIVTIEEDRLKISQNYLSNASGIENNRIVYGTATEVDWRAILDALPELSSLPIFIADDPVKLGQVEAAIRKMVIKHKCELIIVDYLQLVDPEEESNENRELTLISRSLKHIFKRLNVAGIAACQLNRGNETNGIRKPTMRDLRGSGSLEQDGDLIILLHREDVYHQGDAQYQKTNQLEAIVVKNKDGPSGEVPLTFCGKTQTISDWVVADPFGPKQTPPHVRVPHHNNLDDI